MTYSAEFDVRFGDIDQAHVIYYPRFFHYFHQAFERWFGEALGVPYPQLVGEHGIGFPSVRVETDFTSPLRYGDRMRISIEVDDIGKRSLTLDYTIYRVADNVLCARAKITTVAIDGEFRSMTIPDWLRERFQKYKDTSSKGRD